MKATVLDPIGMAYSAFQQPLPPEKAVQAASGHLGNGEVVQKVFYKDHRTFSLGNKSLNFFYEKFVIKYEG